MTKSKLKMIVDVDTGIDDSLALAYAIGSKKIDLIGVTGIYGNVQTEQAVKNSLKILDLLGQRKVPVYEGQSHPLQASSFTRTSQNIHGKNGIGDVYLNDSARTSEILSGVDFIIEACKQYGKDLAIVALGPMTNLTAAITKAPEIIDMIGDVTIMGGALTVCGNVTPFAEANISKDAESAMDLFKSNLAFTMIGLDVTQRTLLTKKETKIWRGLETKSGNFFADMADYYIDAYAANSPGLKGCALHDPLAVAVAADPELITALSLHMKVEVDGPSRGRTIGDNDQLNDPDPNVTVGVNVDSERFKKEFMDTLTNLFSEH